MDHCSNRVDARDSRVAHAFVMTISIAAAALSIDIGAAPHQRPGEGSSEPS